MTPRPPLVPDYPAGRRRPADPLSAFRYASHSAWSTLYDGLRAAVDEKLLGQVADDMIMTTSNQSRDWITGGINVTLFGPGLAAGARLTSFLEETG